MFAPMILVLFLSVVPARAQVLKAVWVDESQERIDEIRKAPLRVLVLDQQGNHVADCPVRIEQTRHAFPFGVRLSPAALAAAPAAEKFDEAPLWRSFNAVSLDAFTHWPLIQAGKDQWDFDALEKALRFAEDRGMTARWGGVISADAGRLPRWAAALRGEELRLAVEAHTRKVIQRYARRVSDFDLIGQTLDHRDLENQLGLPAIRRLHQLAEADGLHRPHGKSRCLIGLPIDDAFTGSRLSAALRHLVAVREAFVPIDAVSIEIRLSGSIVEAPVTRSVKFLGEPGVPVIVSGLEVAGPTPAAAAINLETALRALFSQPGIRAIYFAGLREADLHDPQAALIDEQGRPNAAGQLADAMIRRLWWSDDTIKTDELGNVRHRVFAGGYRIRAALPGGAEGDAMEAEVFLPPGSREKLIVLQPAKRAVASPAVSAENP